MPGRWETRADLTENLLPNQYSSRQSFTARRVWVEDPALFGRSEFQNESEARAWSDSGQRLMHLERLAATGDRAARRESDRVRSGMWDAVQREAYLQQHTPRERETLADWYTSNFQQHTRTGRYLDEFEQRHTRTGRYLDEFVSIYRRTLPPSRTATEVLRSRDAELEPYYRVIYDDVTDDISDVAKFTAYLSQKTRIEKAMDEVKQSMTTTTAALDMYNEHMQGKFEQTFIAITKTDPDYLTYWQTNGRIAPRDVIRVLIRYYSTQELVNRLYPDSGGAPGLIHPDPSKLCEPVSSGVYEFSKWRSAARGYKVALWRDGRWTFHNGSKGQNENCRFDEVDPFSEFDE